MKGEEKSIKSLMKASHTDKYLFTINRLSRICNNVTIWNVSFTMAITRRESALDYSVRLEWGCHK